MHYTLPRTLAASVLAGALLFVGGQAAAQTINTYGGDTGGGGGDGGGDGGGGFDISEYELVKKDGNSDKGRDDGRISSVTTFTGPRSTTWRGLNKAQQELYTGIIPGVRETLPHILPYQINSRRGANRLTWIGVQRIGAKTRVFIQTGRSPSYRLERGANPNELLVVLNNTRPSLSNFWRRVDARWIPRSVSYIRSYKKRRSRDTIVSIRLKSKVEFAVSTEGNFVYVDFDDGHMEPSPEAPVEDKRLKTVYDDPDLDN